MAYLSIRNASYSYNNGLVLKGIDLSVEQEEMVGLLGPNGSGKTTLLKLVSGIIKPKNGDVTFKGTALSRLNRNTIARSIAVVPQQFSNPFAFTVEEVVNLGRTPFRKAFEWESEADRKAISQAMELTDIDRFGGRRFDDLSGGERQKVILAMALAQEPELLLLDEPTVHLDISHQIEILERVKKLNADKGLTVIAAMHDLNLAAFYFGRLILLKEGEVAADGSPSEVLTESLIREVYATNVRIERDPETGVPYVHLTPRDTFIKRL